MNLSLLHSKCKEATRTAFNEYKRQIEIDLFTFDTSLHETFKIQMFQDIATPVTKHFINNYNLSDTQLKILRETIKQYQLIASKTTDNYSKRRINLNS